MSMRAITIEKYGSPDVLTMKEVEKPVLQDNEVLIKVRAFTVTSGDARIRNGSRKSLPMWPISKLAIGLRKPRKSIMGMDYAGEVVSIGKNVTKFQAGEEVYGFCGKGTYTEYISVPEHKVTLKPSNISFEEAGAVPFGATSALDFLRKGNVQSGQNILVYGASGSVGTYAIQLAKYFGATVIGVCSTANVELVKSLGADRVIDYTIEDFTDGTESYDMIFDTVGKTTFKQCKPLLKENGRYVLAVFDFPEIAQMLWTSKIGSKKVIGGIAREEVEDLQFLKDLIEKEKINAVIDRCYSFEQVKEAHSYVDKGHKKGNVVITMET